MKKCYQILLMIICLLSVSVTACGNNWMQPDTDYNTKAAQTLLTPEETEADTTSTPAALEEDEVTRNLYFLQNGDTRPLVGLSFGDVLDYDGYAIRGWSSTEVWYRREDCAYGDVGLIFGGKGNGFSGLKISWNGNLCGIILGEDTVDAFTEVLGEPDTWEEESYGNETSHWAFWNFENAVLSVRINKGKVRGVEYRANGHIADAKEMPETETDFWIDRMAGSGTAEVVYEWSATGWNSDNGFASYLSYYDDDYDIRKVNAFVQNYLQEQEINKDTPDGVSYNQNGDLFVEYYVDREKRQYCFIVHLWNEYSLDYEKGISQYQDTVYCTTYTLHDDDKAGYVLREQDMVQNTNRERLYDIWGKKVADVSYEYIPQIPFPLITESWNLTAGFSSIPLIRNQKMWFYKEYAQFDADGSFFIDNNDPKYTEEFFPYSCRTVYDTDGRLTAIQEERQEEDIEREWGSRDGSVDYSGQIAFDYYEDGTIKSADYVRSSYTHGGTTDTRGNIVYDQEGRMIYNEYYVTHGGDASIYLYEEDSDMPWCELCWCSYAPGFEAVYLFLPASERY